MKVSIIIPFYNAEDVLASSITSAIEQSYGDIEVILVDDGSSDRSLSIARSFCGPNVKVFAQPNGGACKARNRGIIESTGDYIQFLDADDMLSADKIKSQMAYVGRLDRNCLLSSRYLRFYDEGNLPGDEQPLTFLDRSWNDPIDWLLHEWEGKGMGQTSIWLTPRHLIEGAGPWDERLSVNQDGEFFCRVLLQASGIRFCESGTVYYRSGNQNSISQSRSGKKASDLLLSYKLYQENVLTHRDSPRVRQALAAKYLSFIYTYYDAYPDLVEIARVYIDELNIPKLPLCGGRNFKRMARLTGVDNALQIRSLLRRIAVSAFKFV